MYKELFPIMPQTKMFLLSVLMGVGLGIIYDVFRSVRVIIHHGKIALFIEDMLYSLLYGFALFTFSVGLTGQIRYFNLFGTLMGSLLQRLTVGNALVWLIRKINDFFQKFFFKPVCNFITKKASALKRIIVKNKPNFKNEKKVVKSP